MHNNSARFNCLHSCCAVRRASDSHRSRECCTYMYLDSLPLAPASSHVPCNEQASHPDDALRAENLICECDGRNIARPLRPPHQRDLRVQNAKAESAPFYHDDANTFCFASVLCWRSQQKSVKATENFLEINFLCKLRFFSPTINPSGHGCRWAS